MSKEPQLVISSLIELLRGKLNQHGDLPVIVVDADTGWRFLLKSSHFFTESNCLEIGIDYCDEEEGK